MSTWLLLQQQVQLHGGVVEEFLERLPDSDRVCNSVAAADVDGDCLLRQHCPLEVVVVVVVAGVVFVSNRDEDEVDGDDAAATVVVDVLSLVGATEPAETTFDEVAVVVGFEELPSTTIWSRPAAVTAGAVRVAAAASSSLPASDCVELPAAAAVVKDATVVLLGCTALMLPVVADSVESWSCRLGVTSGGGGVPAGDILDPAVC